MCVGGLRERSFKGFTLIELITVLALLGIIVGIAIPRYSRIHSQAEYESDELEISNMVRLLETYLTQRPDYLENKSNVDGFYTLTLTQLINDGVIDDLVLKRKNDSRGNSVKNEGKAISDVAPNASFIYDANIGSVTEASLQDTITSLIGNPLYS